MGNVQWKTLLEKNNGAEANDGTTNAEALPANDVSADTIAEVSNCETAVDISNGADFEKSQTFAETSVQKTEAGIFSESVCPDEHAHNQSGGSFVTIQADGEWSYCSDKAVQTSAPCDDSDDSFQLSSDSLTGDDDVNVALLIAEALGTCCAESQLLQKVEGNKHLSILNCVGADHLVTAGSELGRTFVGV